jgi:hypothetical protein
VAVTTPPHHVLQSIIHSVLQSAKVSQWCNRVSSLNSLNPSYWSLFSVRIQISVSQFATSGTSCTLVSHFTRRIIFKTGNATLKELVSASLQNRDASRTGLSLAAAQQIINTISVTNKLFSVSNIIFYAEFKNSTRMFLSPITFLWQTCLILFIP